MRLVRPTTLFLALLAFRATSSFGESPVLTRSSSVAAVQTLQGSLSVEISSVIPARDVSLVVLGDSLTDADLVHIRRALSSALTSVFLSAHAVRIVRVAGTASTASAPLANPAQLQAALKSLSPGPQPGPSFGEFLSALGGVPASLSGAWAQSVLIGRLPSAVGNRGGNPADKNDLWPSAWLGDLFRKQRNRISFWSLNGAAPAWAQSVSGASMGTIATGEFTALLPMLNDDSPLTEIKWDTKLAAGAWPYSAELKNAAKETVASIAALASAPGFTLPLSPYLAARDQMQASGPDDESVARTVLTLNPSDVDALRRVAALLGRAKKPQESADSWRRLTVVTPSDGSAWAELGSSSFSAQAFDAAAEALARAAALGIKNRTTLETQARLLLLQNNFSAALPLLQESLAADKNAQELWLLEAACAHGLNRWPLETESLEHAGRLGPLPLDRTTALIAGYLAAGQPESALPHLRSVTPKLPADAPIRAQYAAFWEQALDPAAAETLWKSALAADSKMEAAYAGLARNYATSQRATEALKVADAGLAVAPASLPLLLAKESALESLGDLYSARRLLTGSALHSKQTELLTRRAHLEDWYGSGGAAAYAALLANRLENSAPQNEVVAICRRGLVVALRDEHPDLAKIFADKLTTAGDRSGSALIQPGKISASAHAELPGGVEPLNFLIFGGGKTTPDRILLDYARHLSAIAPPSAPRPEWDKTAENVHEYFRRIAALSALGARRDGQIEISLTLATKPGKLHAEKVFDILGLKLRSGKEGVSIKSAEGKSQTKKQDTLAALAIDDQAMQATLAAGQTYTLELATDSVPVFPAPELWQQAFFEHEHFPGGLAEAFVADIRLPQLYLALNSMDRAAAETLLQSASLRTLSDRYGASLSLYSAALALNGTQAEIPGGQPATAVWRQLVGVSPANAVPFFEALLTKDEGRLMAFFYTLSQLDVAHQKFFTRSPQRAKRFFDLFRESAEMRRGGEHRLGKSSFVEFLREVPLNDDASVDFPGTPEVWMVAKGHGASGSSVSKMTRKLKRTAAPDDEDEILIRLANTAYKAQNREQSELANFIAVTRIDAQRENPLSADSALLLAQGYSLYGGLYPYFAGLGDLETADYQALFSLAARFDGLHPVTANLRLAELHSLLAMLAVLHENGTPNSEKVYRTTLDRFLKAGDGAAWTIASLDALDDLAHAAAPVAPSRDEAIRALLLSDPRRQKAYAQVIALQKAPSLDTLFTIRAAIKKGFATPDALGELQQQIAKFQVLDTPKDWKLQGDRKKSLDLFDNGAALMIVAKMREKLARRKRNPAEIDQLSAQLLAELEPWTGLAMTGCIYARYLDPSDLLVSEDPLLLRKHEFISLNTRNGKIAAFTPANLEISSQGEGSYFVGGLAELSIAAGHARALGNHIGGGSAEAFASALFASVRGTDWRALTAADLQAFGATVRLAREWIVESASSEPMRRELETQSRGILSLTRRKSLLEAVAMHDWPAAWESVSISDLHFLGDALHDGAAKDLWNSPILSALQQASAHTRELDELGPVAPSLSGCAQPRLRRYEPYEEYQRHFFPDRLAERLAELKLYLAWLADSSAWPPDALAELAAPVADELLRKVQMRDMWDWRAALDAFRSLKAENLEPLLGRP